MSIERELTEESWGKLNNEDQALYEKDGESYRFIGVNPSKLISAKNRERDLANRYKKEFMEYKAANPQEQEELPEPTAKASTPNPDLEKLKRKLEEREKRHAKELQIREAELRESVLQRHIHNVVSKVFEDSHIGSMIVEKRMEVQIQDGKPKLLVKNREGEVDDDWGVDELIKDLNADDRYSKHLSQGKATGGHVDSPSISSTPSTLSTPGGYTPNLDASPQEKAVANYMGGRSITSLRGPQILEALQAGGIKMP